MPEYDFFSTVRADLEQLRKEIDVEGVHQGLETLAQRLGASPDETLAVLWRTSKRHGETLPVFVAELAAQHERELARRSDDESEVQIGAQAQADGGARSPHAGDTAPRL